MAIVGSVTSLTPASSLRGERSRAKKSTEPASSLRGERSRANKVDRAANRAEHANSAVNTHSWQMCLSSSQRARAFAAFEAQKLGRPRGRKGAASSGDSATPGRRMQPDHDLARASRIPTAGASSLCVVTERPFHAWCSRAVCVSGHSVMRELLTLLLCVSTTLATTTIPLRRRSAKSVPGEHPLIHLERHRNSAERLLARYDGRAAPLSVDDMRARLDRRWRSLPATERHRFVRRELVTEPTETLVQAARPTASAGAQAAGLDIVAYDAEPIGYVVEVQIGGKPFSLLVDTGSVDTYVCHESSAACKQAGQPTISTSTSSTLVVENDRWQVEYGSGWVAGKRAKDTLKASARRPHRRTADRVQIGSLSIVDYAFGVSMCDGRLGDARLTLGSFEGTALQDTLHSGLIGLGIAPPPDAAAPESAAGPAPSGSASTTPQPVRQTWSQTPIQALKAQGLVSKNQVGYALGRVHADGTTDGSITFGGHDASRVEGQLFSFPNGIAGGFWRAPLTSVAVSGSSDQPIDAGLATAILDTGSASSAAGCNALTRPSDLDLCAREAGVCYPRADQRRPA